MLHFIDSFLNDITMYRLVLYSLFILAGISTLFGFFGLLPFSGLSYLFLFLLLATTCYLTQKLCNAFFHSASNTESYIITALILFFIVSPIVNTADIGITITIGCLAIISKYLLAIEKKHLFNPAAIAVFIPGLFGVGNAIWWIGSSILLPFTLVFGFLIVRKIRRFHLVWPFLLSALLVSSLFNLNNGLSVTQSLTQTIVSWPLIFFATYMLTEPMTTPPRKKLYMLYAGFVGVFFGSQFHTGPVFSSPELSLIVGNVFSYIVSPKQKLFLHLKQKIQLAPGMYEFIFAKNKSFTFLPGQYLEWTLPHNKVDSRGNRRYFTIASSPTEEDIKLGVKVVNNASSYKKALETLEDSKTIVASQLAGDFVLPDNFQQKLVFIAGGIGITPFRSMLQYLMDTQQKRNIILLYAASSASEFVYQNIFIQAQKTLSIPTHYIVTDEKNIPSSWKGESGYITDTMIKRLIPDYAERVFYLSGPNKMVEAYKKLLVQLGISRTNIITDYFPGFA